MRAPGHAAARPPLELRDGSKTSSAESAWRGTFSPTSSIRSSSTGCSNEQEAKAEQLVAGAIERLPHLDADKRVELVAEVERQLGERSFLAWRLRQRVDELNADADETGEAEGEPEAA
jgi:hypothetical protein